MPEIERAGNVISYEVSGEGQAIALLHSFLCDRDMWRHQSGFRRPWSQSGRVDGLLKARSRSGLSPLRRIPKAITAKPANEAPAQAQTTRKKTHLPPLALDIP